MSLQQTKMLSINQTLPKPWRHHLDFPSLFKYIVIFVNVLFKLYEDCSSAAVQHVHFREEQAVSPCIAWQLPLLQSPPWCTNTLFIIQCGWLNRKQQEHDIFAESCLSRRGLSHTKWLTEGLRHFVLHAQLPVMDDQSFLRPEVNFFCPFFFF